MLCEWVLLFLMLQRVSGSASGGSMQPCEPVMLPQALLLSGMMSLLGGFIWRKHS